jgi:hypothetical protein
VIAPEPVPNWVPSDSSTSWWVGFLVLGVMGLGCGGAVLWMLSRAFVVAHRQLAESARRRAARGPSLQAGLGRVVVGKVDVDGDDPVVVRVRIEQEVGEHRSGSSRWYSWDERFRLVQARPFYLRAPDGAWVYVVADESVHVAAKLETSYRIDRQDLRHRTAEIRRGEVISAEGELVRGPHPRGAGWVLRASSSGRVALASDVVEQRYVGRVLFFAGFGALLALVLGAGHRALTYPTLCAWASSTPDHAQVTDLSSWRTSTKGHVDMHYRITARLADGMVIADEFDQPTYDWVSAAKARGTVDVPVLRSSGTSRVFFGSRPYLAVPWAVAGPIAAGVVLFLLRWRYRRALAWYDRPKLDEPGAWSPWMGRRPPRRVPPQGS